MVASNKRPKWRTVRVTTETYELLERMRNELGESYRKGVATALVPSDRNDRVTQAALIRRALDLLQDHRERGNRASQRRTANKV